MAARPKEPASAPQAEQWYPIALGSSLKDPSKRFYSLRYEFKPASIDTSRPGSLHKSVENKVTVEHANNQPGKPKVAFQGISEDCKDSDAILFFDGRSFRLERLHRAVKTLRHIRQPGESSSAAAASAAASASASATAAAAAASDRSPLHLNNGGDDPSSNNNIYRGPRENVEEIFIGIQPEPKKAPEKPEKSSKKKAKSRASPAPSPKRPSPEEHHHHQHQPDNKRSKQAMNSTPINNNLVEHIEMNFDDAAGVIGEPESDYELQDVDVSEDEDGQVAAAAPNPTPEPTSSSKPQSSSESGSSSSSSSGASGSGDESDDESVSLGEI